MASKLLESNLDTLFGPLAEPNKGFISNFDRSLSSLYLVETNSLNSSTIQDGSSNLLLISSSDNSEKSLTTLLSLSKVIMYRLNSNLTSLDTGSLLRNFSLRIIS